MAPKKKTTVTSEPPAKRKRGGQLKYSEELIERILIYISMGSTPNYAFAQEGLSRETLRRWLIEYPHLHDLFEAAKASALHTNLMRLNAQAEKGNTQATIFLLERRFPDLFKQQIDVNIDVTSLSDEDLESLAAGNTIKLLNSPSPSRIGEEKEGTYEEIEQMEG